MSFNVAIDGPAGAGKSTIARAVAKKKGFIYVDTGAMYRAMALFMLREGVEPTDAAVIADKCKEADITIQYVDGEQVVLLNGENVNAYLRTEEVGNMASNTSAQPAVRTKLVELQQALAAKSDVIMDGRDIGTRVLIDAPLARNSPVPSAPPIAIMFICRAFRLRLSFSEDSSGICSATGTTRSLSFEYM